MTPFNMIPVEPPTPTSVLASGLHVAAERVADTGGRVPVAWRDAHGSLMPVEQALVFPALPDGAEYIYDIDEVRRMTNRLVVIASPSDVAAVTGALPKAPMRTSIGRAAKRAIADPQGRG